MTPRLLNAADFAVLDAVRDILELGGAIGCTQFLGGARSFHVVCKYL